MAFLITGLNFPVKMIELLLQNLKWQYHDNVSSPHFTDDAMIVINKYKLTQLYIMDQLEILKGKKK